MILLLNITNHLIQGALSDGTGLNSTFDLRTEKQMTESEYFQTLKPYLDNIDEVVIASVVPSLNTIFETLFKNMLQVVPDFVGPGFKTGIMCKTDEPKSVGTDMILDAAGSLSYGDRCLIIDLGTAIKYIYRESNTVVGTSFSPGFVLSLGALIDKAALLTEVEIKIPPKVLTNDTRSCLQSGAVYGTASEIDGMIFRIQTELNRSDFPIVVTGKHADLFQKICNHRLILDENLPLKGLLSIFLKNKRARRLEKGSYGG